MLWLCIYLPRLALDAMLQGIPNAAPLAVTDSRGAKRWIVDANEAAKKYGIAPQQSIDSAYALLSDVRLYPRQVSLERQLQQQLADQVCAYSSMVACYQSNAVMVEVGASRKLFGGLHALLAHFSDATSKLYLTRRLCIAPSVKAAYALARTGQDLALSRLQPLPAAIANLPLSALELNNATVEMLQTSGISNLGEVLELPRAGLAQRIGQAQMQYLDRLLGKADDPLTSHPAPEHFSAALDLPQEIGSAHGMSFAIQRMLKNMEVFLRARDEAISRLDFSLSHFNQSPTKFSVGLQQPDRNAQRILNIVRERLERVALPAPVRSITLTTNKPIAFEYQMQDLFAQRPDSSHQWHRLYEMWLSRLGEQALTQLQVCADHRPEYAYKVASIGHFKAEKAPDQAITATASQSRPVWLLSPPQPWQQAPPILLTGPERIESGWWDGKDVCRDYYIAKASDGRRYWLFRDRRHPQHGWFIHGWFE